MARYYVSPKDKALEVAEAIRGLLPAGYAASVRVRKAPGGNPGEYQISVPHGARTRMSYEVDRLVERLCSGEPEPVPEPSPEVVERSERMIRELEDLE